MEIYLLGPGELNITLDFVYFVCSLAIALPRIPRYILRKWQWVGVKNLLISIYSIKRIPRIYSVIQSIYEVMNWTKNDISD